MSGEVLRVYFEMPPLTGCSGKEGIPEQKDRGYRHKEKGGHAEDIRPDVVGMVTHDFAVVADVQDAGDNNRGRHGTPGALLLHNVISAKKFQ
jgi:hypothetical protein